jgi:hypothetical protein
MSYELWCKHYNGLHSKICRAGVDYKDVKDPAGEALHLPCFKDQGCTERCTQAVFRTPEEIAEEERKSNEIIAKYLDNLKNDICPHCKTPIQEQKQVGRCVYSVPCGCRLYQGKAKKKAGQDETPSQNALF